jgi:2-polyprenyl-3-methyl-5-hydroxy-6-metoxy-1,4-benzoquinol methylase
MTMLESIKSQIKHIREHTQSYVTDEQFMAQWTGLSATDIAVRTQQQKAFVKLVGQVAKDLKGMRILDVGCGDGRWLRWYMG